MSDPDDPPPIALMQGSTQQQQPLPPQLQQQPHQSQHATPRGSLGSNALSYNNSSSSISPSTSSSGGSHGSAKTAVSECLGAWLNYLQILNNLCASGYRLTQSISTLEQWGESDTSLSSSSSSTAAGGGISTGQHHQQQQYQGTPPVGTQFSTAWDDLAR